MELTGTTHTATTQNNGSQNHLFALSALTSLFFIWGFITCMNDILIPHLKNVFSLSYAQAMLIQFCFFGAYFLVSVPAGMLVKRIGYKHGIVSGLIVAAIGCLLFYPAADTPFLRDFPRGFICAGVRHYHFASISQPLCNHTGANRDRR